MSDQTPPSDQPTPPPSEGAGDGHEHEATTPPPPPPAETAPFEAEEPPKKSRKGLLIGVIAAVVVLVLIGGAVTAYLVTRGPETHAITVTSSAGGMKRDKAQETKFKQGLDITEQQFAAAFNVTGIKMGIYDQNKASRGPEGPLLLIGFKFKKPSEKHPATFVKTLKKNAKANGLVVTNLSTGDAGGKAVCLATGKDAAQRDASCFWITRDSGGALLPTDVHGYEAKQMGKLMQDVRADVEKTT